jgi:hypothetical protein
MGTDRLKDDTEANTIVRPLYLFITIVIIKEGRIKRQRFFINYDFCILHILLHRILTREYTR